jgi:hypothetical protein
MLLVLARGLFVACVLSGSGAWSSLSPHLAIAYAYAFQAREVQHLREQQWDSPSTQGYEAAMGSSNI